MAAAPDNYGDMLGKATFVLAVDSGEYNRKLIEAEKTAKDASNRIGQAFGRGGGAGMGLLYASQAVDDLQYGFRAIVNNIPQIAMAMGGGAGLAGAVGIVAVGINQLTQHWDEFAAAVGGTELGRTVTGGLIQINDALAKQGETWESLAEKAGKYIEMIGPLGGLMPLARLGFGGNGAEGGGALAAGRAADAAAGAALWDKAGREVVNKQKAADFAKAIEESGGLQAVLDTALKAAMRAPGADEATQKGRIAKWYAEGMRGGTFNPGAFDAGFGATFAAQQKIRDAANERKATDALNKARDADAERIGKEVRARAAAKFQQHEWDVEDQAADLRKRARFLQDRAGEMGRSQVFQGTRAFATNIMTDALNRIPQAQLDEAKRLNGLAEKMLEELRKERRFAVFK